MNKVFLLTVLGLLGLNVTFAQSTNCGQAVWQLQNYANQVNQAYYNEYWSIIPNQRCPAVVVQCCNQWGQQVQVPANPQQVQQCRWQMLSYLNNWYGQQCNYVNSVYVQIMQGCASSPQDIQSKPAPRPMDDDTENAQIDTEQIEEMTVGIDEDKAIPIKIPTTAAGFRPR